MNKITKLTGMLMVVTILTKGLGFIREMILAAIYGTSIYSDAYLTAMNIPIVLFSIIGMAISTTFIPMYNEVNRDLGSKKAIEFTNNILNIVIILCIVLSLFGILFTEQLVKIFALGFKGEVLDTTIYFTRITIIGISFIGASYVMTGYLHSQERFIITGIVGVPKNIIIIISIILSSFLGVKVLILGTLLGMLTDFLVQIPSAVRGGYKYRFYLNIKDEYIKKTLKLLMPVIIGVGINQINGIIDRSLASTLESGSISALNYANRLNGFIMALFIMSIVSILYPKLSKIDYIEDNKKFKELLQQYIKNIIIIIIPISILTIVLGRPIIMILFERGQFDSKATNMTESVLVFYSIGMFAFGLRELLNKIFYSIKDTKTPMINGAISIIINIVLNIILVKLMGISGLAFATSISAILCILLLLKSLRNKIGEFGQIKLFYIFIKSIIAGSIMAISVVIIYKILIYNINLKIFSLIVSVLVGGIVYIVLLKLLNVKDRLLIINNSNKN